MQNHPFIKFIFYLRLTMVTRSLRFYNFLYDSFFYLVLAVVVTFLLRDVMEKSLLRSLLITFYYVYYLTFELMFGQTFGKMITKTKVVSTNNETRTIWSIVFRTILRINPIDFLSYLMAPQGMHDRFSKTELIRINDQQS